MSWDSLYFNLDTSSTVNCYGGSFYGHCLCLLKGSCIVTDGSEANSAACWCEEIECTESTGLICYSMTGHGSCRNNTLGSFGYPKLATSETCASAISESATITTKVACEAAATILGLNDTVAALTSSSTMPWGCYVSMGRLKFNDLHSSVASCLSGMEGGYSGASRRANGSCARRGRQCGVTALQRWPRGRRRQSRSSNMMMSSATLGSRHRCLEARNTLW